MSILSLVVTAVNHYIAIGRALEKQKISSRTNYVVLFAILTVTVGVAILSGVFQSSVHEPLCLPLGSGLADIVVVSVSGFVDVTVLVVVFVLYTFMIAAVKNSARIVSEVSGTNIRKIIKKVTLKLLTNTLTIVCYISLEILVSLNVSREIYTWIMVFGMTCNACIKPNTAHLLNFKLSGTFQMHSATFATNIAN